MALITVGLLCLVHFSEGLFGRPIEEYLLSKRVLNLWLCLVVSFILGGVVFVIHFVNYFDVYTAARKAQSVRLIGAHGTPASAKPTTVPDEVSSSKEKSDDELLPKDDSDGLDAPVPPPSALLRARGISEAMTELELRAGQRSAATQGDVRPFATPLIRPRAPE